MTIEEKISSLYAGNDTIESEVKTRASADISAWGSRNPSKLFNEEFDNQMGANPSYASISITRGIDESTIITENDGNMPTISQALDFDTIGQDGENRPGVGQHRAGQTIATCAARSCSTSIGTLKIDLVTSDGYRFSPNLTVDGATKKLDWAKPKPRKTDETPKMHKVYGGVMLMEKEDIAKERAKIEVKINEYTKTKPDFEYYFDGDKINPQDDFYPEYWESGRVKHYTKNYKGYSDGVEFEYSFTIVNVHDLVKPDGFTTDLGVATNFDKLYDLGPETMGIKLYAGNTFPIFYGEASWEAIRMPKMAKGGHSTDTGIKVFIDLRNAPKKLTNRAFDESQEKNSKIIPLETITNERGEHIFKEMVKDINKKKNEFKRGTNTRRGKISEEKQLEFGQTLIKAGFSEYVKQYFSEDMKGKKISTLLTYETKAKKIIEERKQLSLKYEQA